MPLNAVKEFFRLEAAGGILLMLAALSAMIIANSPLADDYQRLLDLRLAIIIGSLSLDKPLLLWINDGLMALFFLLVGLELKREMIEGQLARKDQLILPLMAAMGGLLMPAFIYWLVNRGDALAMNGWAIPTATDIAFTLGVLSLLGDRVPLSLKLLLTTIAIVDDLAAILIIAIFYTGDVAPSMLAAAGVGIVVLALMNARGVMHIPAYLVVGLVIWVLVLKSGVHATLAGVVTAAFIPLKSNDQAAGDLSPARHLEHQLHPWIAYLVLPLFAFSNAGVSLFDIDASLISQGVPLGIFLGLVIGKPSGVFLMAGLTVVSGLARLPEAINWRQLFGLSVITGIGFTMSLFIGGLAFEHGGFEYDAGVRISVLAASIVSALVGYAILRLAAPRTERS